MFFKDRLINQIMATDLMKWAGMKNKADLEAMCTKKRPS